MVMYSLILHVGNSSIYFNFIFNHICGYVSVLLENNFKFNINGGMNLA